jgi:hypothetical protein
MRLIWLAVILFTFSALASEIPEDFAQPKSTELFCWGLLQRLDYALNKVNLKATRLLARAAYFSRDEEVPAINLATPRPFVYRVSDEVDKNTPQLLNETEGLLYKVIGKSPNMKIEIQLLDKFLGNQTASYNVTRYQLNFLLENRDPKPEDMAQLNHFSQRALEDFRVRRRQTMTNVLRGARSVFHATVTPGTTHGPEQVPVIHLVYDDVGRWKREAWIGFGATKMSILVEAEEMGEPVEYRLLERNYVQNSVMLNLAPDWIKTTDFTFERLWERAEVTFHPPEWARLLPR